jgi:hypothetical protein
MQLDRDVFNVNDMFHSRRVRRTLRQSEEIGVLMVYDQLVALFVVISLPSPFQSTNIQLLKQLLSGIPVLA